MFQSTPPHGRRLDLTLKHPLGLAVSIHASAREATLAPVECGGRVASVSIHASAREATFAAHQFFPDVNVSIHASAREATLPLKPPRRPPACFNPRLRTGGDYIAVQFQLVRKVVSIHASAREATLS